MATSLLIGSLIVALASPGTNQKSPAGSMACSLLAPADIEAATGVKPDAEPHPGEMAIPGTKETMRMCTWIAPGPPRDQVVVSTAPMPPGTDVVALAKNNAGTDALRAQHWNEVSKEFGNAYCSIMTPPAGTKDTVLLSSCTASVKGTLLSVVFMSPEKKLSIDQAKSLLDKAAARLP